LAAKGAAKRNFLPIVNEFGQANVKDRASVVANAARSSYMSVIRDLPALLFAFEGFPKNTPIRIEPVQMVCTA
jgi:hypothetical protein